MNPIARILKQLLASFSSSASPRPPQRFRVFNATRNTEIAANVEVATTSAQRSKGLLGRNALADGEGLWIVPCESVHTFGMRFAIDLVYLDRQLRVKKIRRAVPPWRISGCLTAHSVIELAAGAVREEHAQPGDVLELFPLDISPAV